MSIIDKYIACIKNRMQPVHEANQDLSAAKDITPTNAAALDEFSGEPLDCSSEPELEISWPAKQAAGELNEIQINTVIETSDGVVKDVDPKRFRIQNPARNQSLDIIISNNQINRSLTGLRGDDKA
jgi:hypothetical protein